ncbi:MAG: hypothetical protein ACI8SJ_000138 [Shewanella sp.]|jgi:hypothetical protein
MKGLLCLLALTLPVASSASTFTLDTFLDGSKTTMANQPALVLYLGGNMNRNYCTVTATDVYLRSSKGVFTSIKNNQPNFDFECNWGGKYYVLSNKHPTYANVTLTPSTSTSPMTMYIDAKLTTLKGEPATFTSGVINLVDNSKQ